MTQEVLKTVCGMDLNNVNTQMALQCAPLIAGIKISNLFIIDNSSIQDALYAFKKYKLSYYFLLRTAKKTTFLLYDRDGLENYLRDESVSELLGQMGYGSNGLMDSLRLFRTRYRQYASENKGFPHELGLFLGYPPEDIEGFKRYKGRNFKCCGYWKVYGNAESAQKKLDEYTLSREKQMQAMKNGVTIKVAAAAK